jgi:hypothetical protein
MKARDIKNLMKLLCHLFLHLLAMVTSANEALLVFFSLLHVKNIVVI